MDVLLVYAPSWWSLANSSFLSCPRSFDAANMQIGWRTFVSVHINISAGKMKNSRKVEWPTSPIFYSRNNIMNIGCDGCDAYLIHHAQAMIEPGLELTENGECHLSNGCSSISKRRIVAHKWCWWLSILRYSGTWANNRQMALNWICSNFICNVLKGERCPRSSYYRPYNERLEWCSTLKSEERKRVTFTHSHTNAFILFTCWHFNTQWSIDKCQ